MNETARFKIIVVLTVCLPLIAGGVTAAIWGGHPEGWGAVALGFGLAIAVGMQPC
jgi:hypothetical protein